MSAASITLRGRRRALGDMVDAGELRGPDVNGPLNQTTGQYTKVPGPLKYPVGNEDGRAKVQTTDTIGNRTTASDRVVVATRFEVHIPMSAAQAVVGDIFTITSSALDPQLVGKRYRVASLVAKSLMTARRMAVEEYQS